MSSPQPSPTATPTAPTAQPSPSPSPTTTETKPAPTSGSTDGTPLTAKGSLDHIIAVYGLPKTGKTTYALSRAVQLARQHHGYLLVHDIGRLPSRFPDGTGFDASHVRSVSDAIGALRSKPGSAICISCPDGAEVIQFGVDLAAHSMKKNGGERGTPVVIFVDEAAYSSGMKPGMLDQEMVKVITGRRWLNVCLIWTCQLARLVNSRTTALATEIVMFRQSHQKDLDSLEEACVPQFQLQRLPTLPKYNFIVCVPGQTEEIQE